MKMLNCLSYNAGIRKTYKKDTIPRADYLAVTERAEYRTTPEVPRELHTVPSRRLPEPETREQQHSVTDVHDVTGLIHGHDCRG